MIVNVSMCHEKLVFSGKHFQAKQYQNLNYLLIIQCSTENTFYTGMHICYLYNCKMKNPPHFYSLFPNIYFVFNLKFNIVGEIKDILDNVKSPTFTVTPDFSNSSTD